MTNVRIWSLLSALEFLRLVRQQPYRLIRAATMTVIVGVVGTAYLATKPGTFGRTPLAESVAEAMAWLVVGLLAACYVCFPLILSTSVLERGAESPTMLLRLTRLTGRELLFVKFVGGFLAFVYACLPALMALGFGFAICDVPWTIFLFVAAFLVLTCIHVGFIALAFSASCTDAALAYRQSFCAYFMLSFIPGAAPWHSLRFAGIWVEEPIWLVPMAVNVLLSLYLPYLAWVRAGEQLDKPDDLVGMKIQPPEETRPAAAVELAQWLFAKLLLFVCLGASIPAMSLFAFHLQERLDDASLAIWLFFQIPAAAVLFVVIALRLSFSQYFDPAGAMYTMMLATPTSVAWWFRRLLVLRARHVAVAGGFFVAAGTPCLLLGWDLGPALWLIVFAEMTYAWLWLFALTLVCRPRFLALPAIVVFLFGAYGLPWLLPIASNQFVAGSAAAALVAALVAIRRPWPATVVLLATALYHARNVARMVAFGLPESPALLSPVWLIRPVYGATGWDKPLVWATLAGDLLVLGLASLWLRWAFDGLVGRVSRRWFLMLWRPHR